MQPAWLNVQGTLAHITPISQSSADGGLNPSCSVLHQCLPLFSPFQHSLSLQIKLKDQKRQGKAHKNYKGKGKKNIVVFIVLAKVGLRVGLASLLRKLISATVCILIEFFLWLGLGFASGLTTTLSNYKYSIIHTLLWFNKVQNREFSTAPATPILQPISSFFPSHMNKTWETFFF